MLPAAAQRSAGEPLPGIGAFLRLPPPQSDEAMQLDPPTWEPPLRNPDPERAPVRVWRLRLSDLDADPLETLRPLTTPDEHARARRFRFDADRRRHLAGRGLVRVLLARRFDCSPRALPIVEGPHGKPHVQDERDGRSPPEFNIAHTADVVMVAMSQSHPVGIDVESTDRDADLDALADRVFTKTERQRWQALPQSDRAEVFFHVWTCKEAFLKATGTGLQRALHTVECQFDGATAVGLDDADAHDSTNTSAARWALHPFRASAGIAGAVVRPKSDGSPLVFRDAGPLVRAPSHA